MTDAILKKGYELSNSDLSALESVDTLEHKIMLGANVNLNPIGDYTPVQRLALRNAFDAEQSKNICQKVKLLLQHGADLTMSRFTRRSPVLLASLDPAHHELVDLLSRYESEKS